MTEKLFERSKLTKKSTLNKTPKKRQKNGARHGRRESAEREDHKERLWRDRVRSTCDGLKKRNKAEQHGNGTSSASVAMCEAFFDTCTAYSHEDLPHTWDSWKQARASAAKCVRVSQKSVRSFFDTKFHEDTQASDRHTRDHNNLTATQVFCNNTLQQ
jgi:uncharacterized membrane protein